MNQFIDIIGSQMDLGASRKGVDMGPLAIRHADLVYRLSCGGFTVKDKGDVIVAIPENAGDPKLRYKKEICAANEALYRMVQQTLEDGHFPLIIGGDHSIAAGSVPAVARHYGSIGVIWIDAHGDFNDETTSPSGNIHGMPLSAVCGLGPDCLIEYSPSRVSPQNVVIIGGRDLDPPEKAKLKANHVTVFPMSEIHSRGILEVTKEAVAIASRGTNGIHLSFDMDAIEPGEAPGVGTPVENGLSLRESFMATEIIQASGKLLSMDLVEVNPLLDTRNRTGILAVNIIMTALGCTDY
ncbi:MAG: arginase [Firmicutes bacterium]|nr:arginase [Bacillota bacterium]